MKEKLSKSILSGWIIIAVTLICYCIYQYYIGIINLFKFVMYIMAVIIPFIIGICTYKLNPFYEKWIYGFGFLITYGIFIFSGMYCVYPYIFPIISLIILFRDKRLTVITGTTALLIQIISIALNDLNTIDIKITELLSTQCLCALLSIYCCYLSSQSFDNVCKEARHNIHVIDRQNLKIEDMFNDTMFVIAQTIDTKDSYTKGHSKRVAAYSKIIAYKLGYSADFCENVYKIGFLHDIGKIGIDDRILNKPGKLTNEEYEIMKTHAEIGANIFKDVQYIKNLRDGIRFHHERWDGHGYPLGLSSTDIPLAARIIAGADMLDAMSSTRCYRHSLTKEVIITEIKRSAGTQLDPNISQAILDLIDEGILIPDK